MRNHAMPRTARSCSGGYTYHVLHRGNARGTVFHKPGDYDAFVDLMAESSLRVPMRVLAYVVTRHAIRSAHLTQVEVVRPASQSPVQPTDHLLIIKWDARPGFIGTANLSATPSCPACPSRESG